MQNIFGLLALAAIAASLIWSGFCAWRIKNRFLKWGGVVLAAVLAVAASPVSALLVVGTVKQHVRRAPVSTLRVEATPERIARGRGLSDGFCGACHSKTGTLTGGRDMGEDFPIPVGSFISSNLTPAGPLKHWSDGEIFRAIRNGVDADGRWLTVMTYTNAGKLSDDDTQAVIAYLRSMPAAGEQTRDPPPQPAGRCDAGRGNAAEREAGHRRQHHGATEGAHLCFRRVHPVVSGLPECHGRRLTGGVPGQIGPLGPDLNLVKQWNLAQFITTMRTGTDPNGHEMSEQMLWRPLGRMDDEELAAVYEYLTHLPGS